MPRLFSPLLSRPDINHVISEMLSKKAVIVDVDLQWKASTPRGLQDRGHANFLTIDYAKGTAYLVDSNGSSLKKNVAWMNGFHAGLLNHRGITPSVLQRFTSLVTDIEVGQGVQMIIRCLQSDRS